MRVELETLEHGLIRAVGRFVGDKTPPGALLPSDEKYDLFEMVRFDTWYASLFETLNWAVALDDRLTRDWLAEVDWTSEVGGGERIRAFRFARNSIHHEWAEAFAPIDGGVKPFEPWVTVLSLEWCDELPSGRPNPDGARAYSQHLAGQGVAETLLAMSDTIGQAIRLHRRVQTVLFEMSERSERCIRTRSRQTE